MGQRVLLVEARMNFVVTAFTGISSRDAGGKTWYTTLVFKRRGKQNWIGTYFIVVADIRLNNWDVTCISLPETILENSSLSVLHWWLNICNYTSSIFTIGATYSTDFLCCICILTPPRVPQPSNFYSRKLAFNSTLQLLTPRHLTFVHVGNLMIIMWWKHSHMTWGWHHVMKNKQRKKAILNIKKREGRR